MTEQESIRPWPMVARCLAVLFAANALFAAIRVADFAIPRGPIKEHLRQAFTSGALLDSVRHSRDRRRGADQQTDGVTMQIAVLGNSTVWTNAFAPLIASPERVIRGQTIGQQNRNLELKEVVEGRGDLANAEPYTRFWHGQSTFFALALTAVSLDAYRSLLLGITLALIAATAGAAAWRERWLFLSLAPMVFVTFFLGGQAYYGQLVSYGPAQIACWSIILAAILFHERLTFARWISLAVTAGALEAFLDMMISIPLVAGLFLIVGGVLLAPRAPSVRASWQGMGVLASAWSFGFAGTYVAKLSLTSLTIGWHAVLDPFLTQLRLRTSVGDVQARMPNASWLGMISENIGLLRRELWNLGLTVGYSDWASDLICWFAVAGWLYALCRLGWAVRERRVSSSLIAGAGWLAASAYVLAWVAAFPQHTWWHSWIMVRITVVWIASGWGWALTDLALRSRGEKGASRRPRELDDQDQKSQEHVARAA